MKSLPIIWQRLTTSDGKTCDRCDATYQELQRGVKKLTEVLGPLGIEPTLEAREIDEGSFRASPSESNRVWIAGKPMEEWLKGRVGTSRCCSVCGESECRTVQVGGTVFEAHTSLCSASCRSALERSDEWRGGASGAGGSRSTSQAWRCRTSCYSLRSTWTTDHIFRSGVLCRRSRIGSVQVS
jgi:hypothetical protein